LYYIPSKKGLKYLSQAGEGPDTAAATLALEAFREFEDPNVKTPGQIARVLKVPESQAELELNYLTREGFIVCSPKPPTPSESPRAGPSSKDREPKLTDDRSMQAFSESDLRAEEARKAYARSDKGKAARTKWWNKKGREIHRKWQKTTKGKAAQARWRSKLRLNERGLQILAESNWTPLHDLLAFVHLEHPTKDQLTEEDFKTLYDNGYI